MVRSLALTAGLAVLLASPVQGQVSITISPFVGGYLPLANVLENIPLGGRTVANVSHKPGLLLGGRLAIRKLKFGIEAEAGYALSNVDLPSQVTDAGVPDDANVSWAASTSLTTSSRRPSPLWLSTSPVASDWSAVRETSIGTSRIRPIPPVRSAWGFDSALGRTRGFVLIFGITSTAFRRAAETLSRNRSCRTISSSRWGSTSHSHRRVSAARGRPGASPRRSARSASP